MGSATTVDPPEGFQLDEPNAMRQGFGRLALSPGKLGDVARVIGNAMSSLYGRIKDAESDPRMPSQMGDHELGQRAMLGPEVLLPAFGRAAGGGGFELAAAGARAGRSAWTPDMVRKLRELDAQFASLGREKSAKVAENFREFYREKTGTDYPGTNATIASMSSRAKYWGGVNEGTGASEAAGRPASDIELGVAGGKRKPPLTALRDALMGDEEFEALASKIRDKLEATHAETVGPAHTTYSQSSPRKEDVIRGVKLTYPTSPERLQEIADHAAAWEIYNKRVGGQDFELGAMGGRGNPGSPSNRILKRDDAQKLIRDMFSTGKTDKEITAALNERFAPLMDEGEALSKAQVANNRLRALQRGEIERPSDVVEPGALPATARRNNLRSLEEIRAAAKAAKDDGGFELGAMGAARRRPQPEPSGPVTAEEVDQIYRDLGYTNVRTEYPKTGNTVYVRGEPPGNPPRSLNDTPIVRVPDNTHLGRRAGGQEIGNRIDTGTPDAISRKMDPNTYQNQSGTPYSDPEAVRAFLEWRRGDLVSPDVAPRKIRETDRSLRGDTEYPPLARKHYEKPTYPDQAPARAEGPDLSSPDQLKLLAGGAPVPSGWQTEVQEGDPGRFARKQPLPNAMVAPQTRELSDSVSGAADAINEDFPETRTTTRRKTMPGLPPGFILDDANPNAMVPR